jgi:F-type H+-transporting ATPase subunit gamma
MATSPRLIRSRIKSVSNTKKITKAMELVSAAKMRRAVALAVSARRYAALGNALLKNISSSGAGANHPFFRIKEKCEKVLVIVIGSDRGLCGAYNSSLLRAVFSETNKYSEVDFITAGRFAESAIRRSGKKIIASFSGLTNAPKAADARPIIALAQNDFSAGLYDAVLLAYTDYLSPLRQVPAINVLLPLVSAKKDAAILNEAIFEPDAKTVLEYTLPRFLESSVYQAVLEAAASEHSSRMMSMRNATEAASEMTSDLVFALNQARQSAITSEIAEISAGRAALED